MDHGSGTVVRRGDAVGWRIPGDRRNTITRITLDRLYLREIPHAPNIGSIEHFWPAPVEPKTGYAWADEHNVHVRADLLMWGEVVGWPAMRLGAGDTTGRVYQFWLFAQVLFFCGVVIALRRKRANTSARHPPLPRSSR